MRTSVYVHIYIQYKYFPLSRARIKHKESSAEESTFDAKREWGAKKKKKKISSLLQEGTNDSIVTI